MGCTQGLQLAATAWGQYLGDNAVSGSATQAMNWGRSSGGHLYPVMLEALAAAAVPLFVNPYISLCMHFESVDV